MGDVGRDASLREERREVRDGLVSPLKPLLGHRGSRTSLSRGGERPPGPKTWGSKRSTGLFRGEQGRLEDLVERKYEISCREEPVARLVPGFAEYGMHAEDHDEDRELAQEAMRAPSPSPFAAGAVEGLQPRTTTAMHLDHLMDLSKGMEEAILSVANTNAKARRSTATGLATGCS